jgi:hypothetical protein
MIRVALVLSEPCESTVPDEKIGDKDKEDGRAQRSVDRRRARALSAATHARVCHRQTSLKLTDLFSLPFSLSLFSGCFLLNLPMKRGGGGNRTRE